MQPKGSGHYVGVFFILLIGLGVFGVSVTLSFLFFSAISPASAPWFKYFAMSLTEVGFICWLAGFLWMRHHGSHSAVAFLMVCLSFLAILATAGTELFGLMPGTSIDVHTSFFSNITGILLETVFIANLLSVFVAAIIAYSHKNPGWWHGGRRGQVAYQQSYQIEEAPAPYPFLPQHNQRNQAQPKEEKVSMEQRSEIEQPRQSPVKQLPPMQMHQGDSFLEVFKDGLTSLFPRRQ